MDNEIHITIDKAAEMLDKSPHCVRQLVQRGKIKKYKIGKNILLGIDSVLTYHSVKKGLPSWEENIAIVKNKKFFSSSYAASVLSVQESYIIRLIKSKQIEGYVTVTGAILVDQDSINAYLRKSDANKSDL